MKLIPSLTLLISLAACGGASSNTSNGGSVDPIVRPVPSVPNGAYPTAVLLGQTTGSTAQALTAGGGSSAETATSDFTFLDITSQVTGENPVAVGGGSLTGAYITPGVGKICVYVLLVAGNSPFYGVDIDITANTPDYEGKNLYGIYATTVDAVGSDGLHHGWPGIAPAFQVERKFDGTINYIAWPYAHPGEDTTDRFQHAGTVLWDTPDHNPANYQPEQLTWVPGLSTDVLVQNGFPASATVNINQNLYWMAFYILRDYRSPTDPVTYTVKSVKFHQE
jgi:hypothetical protein